MGVVGEEDQDQDQETSACCASACGYGALCFIMYQSCNTFAGNVWSFNCVAIVTSYNSDGLKNGSVRPADH